MHRKVVDWGFPISNQELTPLYDVPHLFKVPRNNLLTKNLNFNTQVKKIVAKWDHIKKFYLLATSKEEKLCPKLTDQHVIKNNIREMNISCCIYQGRAQIRKGCY